MSQMIGHFHRVFLFQMVISFINISAVKFCFNDFLSLMMAVLTKQERPHTRPHTFKPLTLIKVVSFCILNISANKRNLRYIKMSINLAKYSAYTIFILYILIFITFSCKKSLKNQYYFSVSTLVETIALLFNLKYI